MIDLHLGDCLEVMKQIPNGSVDAIICDLPYGCLSGRSIGENAEKKGCYSGSSNGCDWDIKLDLDAFWKQIKRIRKDEHTPCIHFCSTKFGYDLIKSNEKEFRYDLVWCKSNAVGFLSANKKPMSSHEMIYVFSKLGSNYKRIDITGDFKSTSGGRSQATFITGINNLENIKKSNKDIRCPISYIEIANKKKKGGHPTEKPLELYKWLIERYSKEGDKVLDPTFGSGNSGLACKELKRNYIGIEMNKEFFDKANKLLIKIEE